MRAQKIDNLVALRNLVLKLAPAGVGIGVADPAFSPATVLPEEAVAIANAIPKRKREFAAGRRAARQALEMLDHPAQAIPKASNRTPVFPTGLTGSITHDRHSALAIVAPETKYRAVGIDVEPDAPLKPELMRAICTPEEANVLAALPQDERLLLGRRLFSAKEAVFKAQFPLTQQIFGFDAVTIAFDSLRTSFTARFTRDIASVREGSLLSGQAGNAGGHIATLVTLGAVQGSQNANFPVCATG
ncbi:MAG: 4'-phosphopantetheinyl transferase superfamily protein [Shimia sp.]|nr:4'-phosphopantetheinyl transferase superfamily protein [Shimia sp.]